MSFEHLKKLEIQGTAPFVFYQVVGEPTLIIASATEANKPYFNALLKKSKKNQKRLQKGNFTAAVILENRHDDRELYVKFIIKGWEQVNDSAGNPAEFNQENVAAFLEALPDYLFDELRNFATEASSFVEDLVDAEELAEN